LAQHERVLGSDGDDERETESESGEQGEHALTLGSREPEDQFMFFRVHKQN
jgi:hypothetical protein